MYIFFNQEDIQMSENISHYKVWLSLPVDEISIVRWYFSFGILKAASNHVGSTVALYLNQIQFGAHWKLRLINYLGNS